MSDEGSSVVLEMVESYIEGGEINVIVSVDGTDVGSLSLTLDQWARLREYAAYTDGIYVLTSVEAADRERA